MCSCTSPEKAHDAPVSRRVDRTGEQKLRDLCGRSRVSSLVFCHLFGAHDLQDIPHSVELGHRRFFGRLPRPGDGLLLGEALDLCHRMSTHMSVEMSSPHVDSADHHHRHYDHRGRHYDHHQHDHHLIRLGGGNENAGAALVWPRSEVVAVVNVHHVPAQQRRVEGSETQRKAPKGSENTRKRH